MKIDKELTYDTFRCVLLKSDGDKNRRQRETEIVSRVFFSYVGSTTNINLSFCFVITSFLSFLCKVCSILWFLFFKFFIFYNITVSLIRMNTASSC